MTIMTLAAVAVGSAALGVGLAWWTLRFTLGALAAGARSSNRDQ